MRLTLNRMSVMGVLAVLACAPILPACGGDSGNGSSTGATAGSTSSSASSVATSAGATAAVGALQLSTSSYSVSQGAGSVTVTVTRIGGSAGAISVNYATANGTAVAGNDYTASSGTLHWTDGDTGSRLLTVALGNGAAFSGSKAFTIALSSPAGGAAISSPASASIVISGSNSSSSSSVGSAASSGTEFWVYHNGQFNWAGDVSYGGLVVNYSSTATTPLSGPTVVSCTGNNGGFQPRAQNDDFDTTPYKYLTVSLKPTIPNQKWVSAFAAVGDKVVSTLVSITSFGPSPPIVGQWNTYKIPLGAGGYQMSPGSHIYKVTFQDETANQPGYSGPTNVWYVDDIAFTAN